MSELLPCPLCGPGKVFLNPPSDVCRYGSINCPACLLTLPGETKDPREMIEVWNTRPAMPVSEPGVWQPIETAPKDGTCVLLFTTTAGDTDLTEYLEAGGDNEIPLERVQCGLWDGDDWHGVNTIGNPTHWMSLPPAPEAQP